MYSCSRQNKRGVAILVSCNLDFNPIEQYTDVEDNYIIIDCTINGVKLALRSVYGPNNSNKLFYARIKNILLHIRSPALLGGDWNTVWDNSDAAFNIDVQNMVKTPNTSNGNALRLMCDELSLTEPFRFKYPDKVQFTYKPFGTRKPNQARLDFFLMSTSLLHNLIDTQIDNSVPNSLFDHKPVRILLGTDSKKGKGVDRVNSYFIDNFHVEGSLTSAIYSVYYHAINKQNLNAEMMGTLNRLSEL